MIEKQLPYKYKVYEIIKEDILSGKYRAGEELNERELAETMGVSRTPVREAIQMLEHNGWVSIETYKGAVIRSFGRKYLADLMKVRTALELSAVEDAAKNITDETFAAIEQTYQQQVAAMDSSNNLDFAQLDRLFHQSIYELSVRQLERYDFCHRHQGFVRRASAPIYHSRTCRNFGGAALPERGPGSPGHETPHGADSL